MKKIIFLLSFFFLLSYADAQGIFGRIGNAAKDAAESAVERNVLNKVEEGIDNAMNKNDEDDGSEAVSTNDEDDSEAAEEHRGTKQGWTCPQCGHEGNTGKFCSECGAKQSSASDNSWTCPQCGHEGNTGNFCDECGAKKGATKQNERAASEWNKFDFVAGDEVIFYDQITNEKLGEFPSQWELLEGEAEIQKVNGENVIALLEGGMIMPLISPTWNYLPETYTIEFDYYEFLEDGDKEDDYGTLELKIVLPDEHYLPYSLWHVGFQNYIAKGDHEYYNDDSKTISTVFSNEAMTTGRGVGNDNRIEKVEFNKWHHVSVSVNKRAVKVYYDETRVANIPNYNNPVSGYFGFIYYGGKTEQPAYIKNVRFAKGAVPLYDRMVTDGKFITYGITFDVGKSVIKPESMGEINRIVKLMTDNPELKFEVQGHTDNTGNAANNQKLSEARANAIVNKLVEMGIAANRLSSVGKGQTSPIADNSTEEGRAKNRRVEFVKK